MDSYAAFIANYLCAAHVPSSSTAIQNLQPDMKPVVISVLAIYAVLQNCIGLLSSKPSPERRRMKPLAPPGRIGT